MYRNIEREIQSRHSIYFFKIALISQRIHLKITKNVVKSSKIFMHDRVNLWNFIIRTRDALKDGRRPSSKLRYYGKYNVNQRIPTPGLHWLFLLSPHAVISSKTSKKSLNSAANTDHNHYTLAA